MTLPRIKYPGTPEAVRNLPEVLGTKDLCDFLGVSPRTLYNWRKDGYGPAYRVIGGRVKYLRDDVIQFLKDSLGGGG